MVIVLHSRKKDQVVEASIYLLISMVVLFDVARYDIIHIFVMEEDDALKVFTSKIIRILRKMSDIIKIIPVLQILEDLLFKQKLFLQLEVFQIVELLSRQINLKVDDRKVVCGLHINLLIVIVPFISDIILV